MKLARLTPQTLLLLTEYLVERAYIVRHHNMHLVESGIINLEFHSVGKHLFEALKSLKEIGFRI